MTKSIVTGNTIPLPGADDETPELITARVILRPDVNAAATIQELLGHRQLDLPALVDSLAERCETVHSGNLEQAEGMLFAQAHTLDAIFNNLIQRAARAEYVDGLDRYLRLAMKAQNQCRSTLQTLGELKNPRSVAFVKQANITNGPQQVNNGNMSTDHAHARENQIQPNELLEVIANERLDTRAPGASGRIDPAMATVGAIDGAADGGG